MFAPTTPMTELTRIRYERENFERQLARCALVSPEPSRVMTFLSHLGRRRPALPRPDRPAVQPGKPAARRA